MNFKTVRGILSDTNLIWAKISWTCDLEQVVQGGGYTSRGLTIVKTEEC